MTIGIGLWAEVVDDLRFTIASEDDVAVLLSTEHYLGPKPTGAIRLVVAGVRRGEVVAAQVWGLPTARRLPNDETWWELARWCLTPPAGRNAGTRMDAWVRRWIWHNRPNVTTLISYSDPSVGHTGALYRACNWQWKPTWHRIKPPPSGAGSWDGITKSEPKDRWSYPLRPDHRFDDVLKLAYWLELPAVAASSDAPGVQSGEGGSQPTLPLHSSEVAA